MSDCLYLVQYWLFLCSCMCMAHSVLLVVQIKLMLHTYFIFRCVLRFPSTNIKISFQSLVEDDVTQPSNPAPPPASPPKKKVLPPLKISIPETASSIQNSPCPSPTGTIRFVHFYFYLLFVSFWLEKYNINLVYICF